MLTIYTCNALTKTVQIAFNRSSVCFIRRRRKETSFSHYWTTSLSLSKQPPSFIYGPPIVLVGLCLQDRLGLDKHFWPTEASRGSSSSRDKTLVYLEKGWILNCERLLPLTCHRILTATLTFTVILECIRHFFSAGSSWPTTWSARARRGANWS